MIDFYGKNPGEIANVEEVDPLAPFLTGAMSPQTARAYRNDMQEFFAWLDKPVSALGEVTPDDILRYRNHLMLELKSSTVARKLSVLRTFFDLCEEYGICRSNPARSSRVKSPKVPGYSLTSGLSQPQAEVLLRQPDKGTVIGLRDYAILSLMIHTGLRRSEVCSIKWDDFVDKLGHRVLIVIGKGNKQRDVKMPPKVWRSIQDYLGASGRRMRQSSWLFVPFKRARDSRPEDNVFEPVEGKALSVDGLWKIIQRYATQAGLGISEDGRKSSRITPHSLRHTFITLALAGGAPLHKVQYAAGHSDPRTTERYDRDKDNLDDNATDYIRLRS